MIRVQSSSRNGAKVIWLAVHTTEGIMRAVDLRAWATWPGSSHASNDETGVLLSGAGDGFVDYSRAAWTLRAANPISDNIEQCGWARWTRAEWLARPKLLDTTARWLADRSKARGIPLVHLSAADIKARKPGVIGHGDYTYATGDGTHTDPGPNYPWDVVLDKARAYAGGASPAEGDDDMTPAQAKQLEDILREVMAARRQELAVVDAKLNQLLGNDEDKNGTDRLGDLWEQEDRHHAELLAAILGKAAGTVDPATIAAAIPADIAEQVVTALLARIKTLS